MSENIWKKYFDNKAKQYGDSVLTSDYFNEKSFYINRKNTLCWIGEIKGKTILDAGCGIGAFSETLVKDNVVYGVDFSEKVLEFSKNKGLQTLCGDLYDLSFDEEKFDITLCIGVMQLVNSCEKVIKELSRVTKQNGLLLIETINISSIQRKIFTWKDKGTKFERMYSTNELKYFYEKYGFKDIEFMYIYYPFNKFSLSKRDGFISRYFSTSFAIKGVKAMRDHRR